MRRVAGTACHVLRDDVSLAEAIPAADRERAIEECIAPTVRRADIAELRPAAVEVYPLASAREAFARSMEPGRRGKVVLAVVV